MTVDVFVLLAIFVHVDGYILPNQTHMHTNHKLTWQQAQDYCVQTYGTYLASIHSENDQAQIVDLIMETPAVHSSFWIGLTNVAGEDSSHYHWSDGSSFVYGDKFGRTPWAENKPNKQAQDHIFLDSEYDLRWNDGHNDMKLFWVCNSPENESSDFTAINDLASTSDVFYVQSEPESVPNFAVHIVILALVASVVCVCVVCVTALYIRKQYRLYVLSEALENQTVFSESNGNSRRSTTATVYESDVLSPLSNHIALEMRTGASYVVAERGEIAHWIEDDDDEEDDEDIERMYDTMDGDVDDLSSDTLLGPSETVHKDETTVLVHEDFGNVVEKK